MGEKEALKQFWVSKTGAESAHPYDTLEKEEYTSLTRRLQSTMSDRYAVGPESALVGISTRFPEEETKD